MVDHRHEQASLGDPSCTQFQGYRGQEQIYFLLDLVAPPEKVDVATSEPEFRAVRWVMPSQVRLPWVPPVKRDVYRQVLRDFFGMEIAS